MNKKVIIILVIIAIIFLFKDRLFKRKKKYPVDISKIGKTGGIKFSKGMPMHATPGIRKID